MAISRGTPLPTSPSSSSRLLLLLFTVINVVIHNGHLVDAFAPVNGVAVYGNQESSRITTTSTTTLTSPSSSAARTTTTSFGINTKSVLPAAFIRQRKSVANVQTMSLFGLGGPEIAVIAIAGILVLGPEKLRDFARESGKAAANLPDDLKEIPEEFKKGVEEGEGNARARKAKKIQPLPDTDDAADN